jgi:hypothetical protein
VLSKRGSELVSRFTKLTKELELYEGDERKRTAALKVLKALSPIGQQVRGYEPGVNVNGHINSLWCHRITQITRQSML